MRCLGSFHYVLVMKVTPSCDRCYDENFDRKRGLKKLTLKIAGSMLPKNGKGGGPGMFLLLNTW